MIRCQLLQFKIKKEFLMKEKHYQIVGLLGFIIAGFIFIAAGINFGDTLTVLGSIIWVLSCMVWMVPLLKSNED
jgi:membrane protein DedA with SNARE-associated domain